MIVVLKNGRTYLSQLNQIIKLTLKDRGGGGALRAPLPSSFFLCHFFFIFRGSPLKSGLIAMTRKSNFI